jgi:hypothetical protein
MGRCSLFFACRHPICRLTTGVRPIRSLNTCWRPASVIENRMHFIRITQP